MLHRTKSKSNKVKETSRLKKKNSYQDFLVENIKALFPHLLPSKVAEQINVCNVKSEPVRCDFCLFDCF